MKQIQIFGIIVFLLSGCASSRLKLRDWTELPPEHYTIPPYAHYLKGFTIALDPGHGGNADLPGYKRGPTGKREAIMNLNVANFLKEFLEKVGVTVFLTRQEDRFVSLQDRADLAAAAGADFMISLHHNASNNPQTNFAAVFYHLTPDYSPFSMDLARNIYFGLVDALHLPQLGQDGLMSDQIVYPAGFGLLRRSKIPAILLESSFYSNPKEEKRLMDVRYNRREAYGIFLGLAKWAAGGLPNAKRIQPAGISQDKQPLIVYRLSDGITERVKRNLDRQLIYAHSVTAQIDSQHVSVKLSAQQDQVSFQPDSVLSNGYHVMRVDLQNMYKNHNFPRLDTLIIAAPTDSMNFQVATLAVPADDRALVPIHLALFDADGESVWDSTEVHVDVNRGSVAPERVRLQNGGATVYYKSTAEIGKVTVRATADDHSDELDLSLVPPGQFWIVSGAVLDDSTGAPLMHVPVTLNDSLFTSTDRNGVYFTLNPPIGSHELKVRPKGYALAAERIQIDSTSSLLLNFRMKANLGGLLHGEVILLDASAESDGFVPGALNLEPANLRLTKSLADTLNWAGANPILVRDSEKESSIQEKIKRINAVPEGWYLKLGYGYWDSDSINVQATIYPANQQGEKIAQAIGLSYADLPKSGFQLLQNTDVPEVTYTNKTAIDLNIACREPLTNERDVPRLLRGIVIFYKMQQAAKLAEEGNSEH